MYQRVLPNGRRASIVPENWIVDSVFQPGEFENLVFGGGGYKGIAYVGALKILQKVGIYQGIKRFAGSSAGAMLAALLSVGYDVDDVEEFLCQDIRKITEDKHTFGIFSMLPKLLLKSGWNSGKKLEKWFQNAIANGPKIKSNYSLNRCQQITFKELYDIDGTELCIVATNLNFLSMEYFHPKTTPDFPIYKAVRMSMSIPGYYEAVRVKHHRVKNDDCIIRKKKIPCCLYCCICCSNWGEDSANYDLYIDGGVGCNYPIHVFDGWWLSMDEKDHFVERMQPFTDMDRFYDVEDRFGMTPNPKTLGLMLYSPYRNGMFCKVLSTREKKLFGSLAVPKKFISEHSKLSLRAESIRDKKDKALAAFSDIVQVLEPCKIIVDGTTCYPLYEAKELIRRTYKDQEHFIRLVCPEGLDSLLKRLEDCQIEGMLSLRYLQKSVLEQENFIDLKHDHLGYYRTAIKGPAQFAIATIDTLLLNGRSRFLKSSDVNRSIGINTSYLKATNGNLAKDDKEFLKENGQRGIIAFLHYYLKEKGRVQQNIRTYGRVIQVRSKDETSI
ncbi:Uncharacterized protein TrispH2_005310 [Trichoplax sp. H2]|nr:Uncharacterized protein TrispH2_005310 [Trichoplax sp. H2]|eukprot:RDD42213.1 Uncharacterized protein TrispH2_005310 [Trichoplax sp. H2]